MILVSVALHTCLAFFRFTNTCRNNSGNRFKNWIAWSEVRAGIFRHTIWKQRFTSWQKDIGWCEGFSEQIAGYSCNQRVSDALDFFGYYSNSTRCFNWFFVFPCQICSGCESETDTEEFEKVGQSPVDRRKLGDTTAPKPETAEMATSTAHIETTSTETLTEVSSLYSNGIDWLHMIQLKFNCNFLLLPRTMPEQRNKKSNALNHFSFSWLNCLANRSKCFVRNSMLSKAT